MDSRPREQLNFYSEFKDCYFKIVNDFKFSYEEDRNARNYLSNILNLKTDGWDVEEIILSFKRCLYKKTNILIYGCGPSLEPTVEALLSYEGKNIFKNSINLAADGASVLLKEKSIHINTIFTDLDGISIEEFNYPEFIIVHAHGDNIDKIRYFKESIMQFSEVIGTTQVEPIENVLNPGGFTDGDRILFFLRALLAPFHKLFLIGMDFKDIIGKYSKLHMKSDQEGNTIKQKKLRYAAKLIYWIKSKIPNEIYFINSTFKLKNFRNLSVNEFVKKLLKD
jgi:uncharacterized Rossmann fold enzyme